jgi:beta-phosphoglucomutase-like phosphatase (HAD superfamily)
MRYKGIIFDFNGVLLWDDHLHEQAWLNLSAKLRGSPFTDEEIADYVHGQQNKTILEYLLKRSITSEELEKLSYEKEFCYRSLCLKNPEFFRLSPGAVDLLDFLVKKKTPRSIATLAVPDNLEFFIEHLHLCKWFDRSELVCDDGRFSDKKEMFTQAATNLHLTPEQCIVIEDSKHGITAASNANIGKIIGLAINEKREQLLKLPGISNVIPSLDHFDTGMLDCT